MLFPTGPVWIATMINVVEYGLASNILEGVVKLTNEKFVKEIDSGPHFVLFFGSE